MKKESLKESVQFRPSRIKSKRSVTDGKFHFVFEFTPSRWIDDHISMVQYDNSGEEIASYDIPEDFFDTISTTDYLNAAFKALKKHKIRPIKEHHIKLSQFKSLIREEIQSVLREFKDPKLIKGVDITIEMDDEDDNFKAGDYTISGLTRGGVILSGMGERNLHITFDALKDAGYTINENVNEADNLGAFRRLVITTNKLDMIKSEIEDYIKRPNIKSDYADAKLSIKPGVKPNVLVVDIEAVSGTALANKISDVVKKFDKTANIKVRKELKLKPIK